jgi:hypothetical protein
VILVSKYEMGQRVWSIHQTRVQKADRICGACDGAKTVELRGTKYDCPECKGCGEVLVYGSGWVITGSGKIGSIRLEHGGVFVNEPRETIDVDGLAIDVSCHHFSHVLHVLERLPLRTFDGGEPYYKTKFWLHATVLTPAQRHDVVRVMSDRAVLAEKRANDFARSMRESNAKAVQS